MRKHLSCANCLSCDVHLLRLVPPLFGVFKPQVDGRDLQRVGHFEADVARVQLGVIFLLGGGVIHGQELHLQKDFAGRNSIKICIVLSFTSALVQSWQSVRKNMVMLLRFCFHVHLVVSGSLSNLKTTGWTGNPGLNAPDLKLSSDLPLVVVPSLKKDNCCEEGCAFKIAYDHFSISNQGSCLPPFLVRSAPPVNGLEDARLVHGRPVHHEALDEAENPANQRHDGELALYQGNRPEIPRAF
jgi:hypothetical protein